jgi:hypothetical protein
MRPSRGMGAVNPSKMPKAKKVIRKDNPNVVSEFSEGGLYANIHAKRKRISQGSGEKMRSVGQAGAPTAQAFKQSAKTAKR